MQPLWLLQRGDKDRKVSLSEEGGEGSCQTKRMILAGVAVARARFRVRFVVAARSLL